MRFKPTFIAPPEIGNFKLASKEPDIDSISLYVYSFLIFELVVELVLLSVEGLDADDELLLLTWVDELEVLFPPHDVPTRVVSNVGTTNKSVLFFIFSPF